MTLQFESDGSSAIDAKYGLDIRDPRIQQGDTSSETEYQYPVYVRGARYGIGFHGTDEVVTHGGQQERVSRLVLAPDPILTSVLNFKAMVACPDDDFSFIAEFARGLVLVHESGIFNYENSRYVVLADEGAFARLGIGPSKSECPGIGASGGTCPAGARGAEGPAYTSGARAPCHAGH